MVAGWHRVGAGLGLALAALVLSGCHAQGTFDVLSEDRVAMDLVVSGDNVDCPNAVDALKLTVTTITDASGRNACHVTGETQATYFSPFGINVSTAAEYLVLQTNLSGGSDDWPTSDIRIRFPGQVVSATKGIVAGNEVQISDLGPLAQGSGLRVVAINRPGPPAWMLAAAAGTGAGVLATLLVLGGVRLARRRPPQPDGPVVLALAEPSSQVGPQDGLPEQPSENGFTDPPFLSGDPPAHLAEPPPDDSWFAAPPLRVNGSSPSMPSTDDFEPAAMIDAPPEDHTVWAPPEERG